jgi:long-chain acyl-CoA synthetase
MANGWPWVVAFHAILRIGAVVVPVNALLTADEVRFIAGHSRATHAILDAPRSGLSRTLEESLGIVGIVEGVQGAAGGLSFQDLLSSPPDETLAPAAPDSLAAIAYTSGTTGRPKGAMLSQRALALNSALTQLMHGRTGQDVVVSALPLPHVYGNVVLNATLRSGGTLVLFPSFDCERIWDALDRHGATMFEGVPTMYYYLLADPRAKSGLRLRLCTVGGQTMAIDKMQAAEALFGCPLVELWGMTELAGLGTTHPHTGPRRYGSIGTALPLLDLRIAEPGSTSEAARGSVGELLVRGPQTMLGYLDDEAATAEAKTADGWLRTGDLAYRDADGFVFVVDRIKDMILTAGYNVYPAELERAIAAHPAVAMVAVGRRADPLKGEIAAAYIVLKPGAEASERLRFAGDYLINSTVGQSMRSGIDAANSICAELAAERARVAALLV